MEDERLLAAYDSYYSLVSVAQARRALGLAGLRPRSVLDLGSGPGGLSLACAEAGATRLSLVDASAKALARARAALEALGARLGRSLEVSTLTADLQASPTLPPGPFDLAAFGHCLNELGEGDDRLAVRLALVRKAAGSLTPDGSVLVMEPATLAASRDALALRDSLVAEGWEVLAPCARTGPCPALAAGAAHTCHDEAAWAMPDGVRRLSEAAGLDRGLIKMTWYVLSPPLSLGEATARRVPPDAYRVVSAPMLNKGGRVRYLLCGPAGRFPFSARKDDEAARRGGFFDLARYDLVTVERPEAREGGWGFGPDTILRRAGRP